ncbi:ABC transporter permease [Lachnoclostridium phytofermentans]|uniref:Binding-protein-dependent transport systems inner membrane component n=1 Tax=Lachnoclostridium phytofermentans (strain ATCC 700394 / DSM 18823 / ISDg) TaxID=357809 RepID=A9KJY6_LACP7|nr:ABC transporter permease subunit [Lachnoclostridium phytofermentans]ABX42558.1 binding-protein-dependent transport systems inner membrane component [Lachnoclostridium phytofermentans ISDg]
MRATMSREKKHKIKNSNWQFWVIIAIPLIYAIVFAYIPMGGVILAFKDYSIKKGILGSDWVGLRYFKQFLLSPSSSKVIWNTLVLGIYSLIASFPIPILLAVGLNEIKAVKFKKTVQMVTYAPYFISTVVMVGMLMQMTDLRIGIINKLIGLFGVGPINFFGNANIFRGLYVWSGVWQVTGYSAIIYIAALAGVSPELKEAAIVDGASRMKRIWHVDLPAIRPTIVTMLIFACGNMINIGFDKVYLMQNSMNLARSEVIATFVYKVGLVNADYGFSTAAGLFQSLVSFLMLIAVNKLSKVITETSLW